MNAVATRFYVYEFTLEAHTSITFSTDAFLDNTDEVLHLLEEVSANTWAQVDYESAAPFWYPHALTSYLDYVNVTDQPKKCRLIVRARSLSTQGWVALRINGLLRPGLGSAIPAGGVVFSGRSLAKAKGGSIYAVPAPGGSEWPVLISFSTNVGQFINQIGFTGGAGGATRIASRTSDSLYMVGTPILETEETGAVDIAREGDARIYVNDVLDSDNDGLGDSLEKSLGTCARSPCYFAATPQDTDRDGLPDGEEVLGVMGIVSDPDDDFALPRWGANPRQKDVFLLMSWRADALRGNPPLVLSGVNPFTTSPVTVNQTTPPLVRTPRNWVILLRSAYLEGSNGDLHNPNEFDGIQVHVDMGLAPPDRFDEAMYGIWSPRIVHNVNPPWILEFRGAVDGIVTLRVDGVPRSFNATGMPPAKIAIEFRDKVTEINQILNGKIKVVDLYKNNNDDDDWILIFDIADSRVGQSFSRSMTVPVGNEDSIVVAPRIVEGGAELDDLELDMIRGGTLKNTNYIPRSIGQRVRLGVLAEPGAGQARIQLNGLVTSLYHLGRIDPLNSHITTGHELGHLLGLSHGGHFNWIKYNGEGVDHGLRYIDKNGHPNYASSMNYVFDSYYHFSRLTQMTNMNPSRVRERTSFVGINVNIYADTFFRLVSLPDNGVDWNLDNLISTSQTQEWNVPLLLSNTGVHAFDQGTQRISNFFINDQNEDNDEDYRIIGAMDIVRANSTMYAFFIRDLPDSMINSGKIFYRVAPVGLATESSCTGSDNPQHMTTTDYAPGSDFTGCLTWVDEFMLPFTNSKGLSAIWWQNRLFVASWNDDNSLIVYQFEQSNHPEYGYGYLNLLTSQEIAPAGRNRGKPELAIIYSNSSSWKERLVVVYNNPYQNNNDYRAFYWNGTSFVFWGAFSQIEVQNPLNPNAETYLQGIGDATIVSWPDVYNTSMNPLNRISCGIFPTLNRSMRVFCFNPTTLKWEEVSETVFPVSSTNAVDCANPADWDVFEPAVGAAGKCLPVSVTPPELSMRYLRTATGAPFSLTEANSNFQLTWTPIGSTAPKVIISGPVSATMNHPRFGQWPYLNWIDEFAHSGYAIADGTNVPMYEDSTMGGMFAISAPRHTDTSGDSKGHNVMFHPHADGSVNMDFWAGSDFDIMEDYTCKTDNGESILVPCGAINISQ